MFERSSLSEQVEAALKEEITSGRMQPGQRISTTNLKSAWNISSTPFRDAVRSLEIQGFVTVEARKGVYVAPLDASAVHEIFDLRIALECMAVERATPLVPSEEALRVLKAYELAQRAPASAKHAIDSTTDRLVHELAWNHCGNKRLQKMLASQMELISWAQRTINRKQPEAYVIALPEHINVTKAICERDEQRAARAMRTHLVNSRELFAAQFLSTEIRRKQTRTQ